MLTLTPRIWTQALMASLFIGTSVGQMLSCPDECECYFDSQATFSADCSGKGLTEIPIGIDEQTQILDLSDNSLTTLPPDYLSTLVYLEKLNLSGNSIEALSSYSLTNLTSLKVLDLSRNMIAEWEDIHPNTILKPVVNLKKLILSKNPFKAIANLRPVEILVSSSVQVLELKNCGFTSVAGRSPIAGLTDLRQLSLAHNPLKRIHRLTSPTLRYLDLNHCELSYIPRDELIFLPSLTHLRLSHNIRLTISDENDTSNRLFSSSLMHIDLSYCNMNHVSLGGFPALEVAILKGNMLRRLQAGVFANNTYLKTLDLSSNAIEYVHKNAFDGLLSLTTLNLSINVIPVIYDYTFLRLYNLTVLNLSRNYLSTVGFLKSSSIVSLDMSYCEIQYFDKGAFEGLTSIEEVNLSKNFINSIPEFLTSKTLKILDLRFNRLSKVNNETFVFLPSLTVLRLSENRFSEMLHATFFQGNPHLDELSLHDNTWRCDCYNPEMKGFYDFITNDPPKVWNINDLRCDTPSNVTGRNWLEACYFIWHPDDILTAHQRNMTYVLLVLISCFIFFFAIMIYKHIQRKRLIVIREQRERELHEERDRLRELRMRREQEDQRNAPDPRDLISPPSYNEALLMPRLDGSYHSLAGVGITQEKKQRKKLRRRTRSSGDLLDIDPESGENRGKRKNKRRRQSTTSEVATEQETTILNSEERNGHVNTNSNERRSSDTIETIVIHRLHESNL